MILLRRLHTKSVPRLYLVSSELLDSQVLPRIPTHELLARLQYVSPPKPGLVHWMPMGMLVLNKMKQLVHKHMQDAGAEEISLSALSHLDLWKQTGRWGGAELFRLKDLKGAEYCLAPTCEEEITHLVQQNVASYKNLPLLFYQINTKFRDEKRPRSGLLRGREFVMKDAYSFDVSEAEAMRAYETMLRAYAGVFAALRAPCVRADADTGEIGGSMSHEWHYVHAAGEDTLFECTDCGRTLNVEMTPSFPAEDAAESLKTSLEAAVAYFPTIDRSTLVCAYYPVSRAFRPAFLRETVPDIDLSGTLSEEEVLALFRDEATIIDKRVVRIMDSRLDLRLNLPDFPVKFANRSLVSTLTDVPLVEAEEGELCAHCDSGTLRSSRAIEVAHTFYLGDRYTRALDCTVEVPGADGTVSREPVLMGCYGIGISRIIAALAEINRDSHGLRWPAAIAPWHVTVVDAGAQEQAHEVARSLGDMEVRLDARPLVRLGRKIRESHAMGIPLVLVVGKRYPTVEIEVRGRQHGRLWETVREELLFDWIVETGASHTKHIVDCANAPKVAAALLADM